MSESRSFVDGLDCIVDAQTTLRQYSVEHLEEIAERLATNPTADDYVAGFVCGLRVLIAEIRDDETSRGVICPS